MQTLTASGAFTQGDVGTMRYTRGNAFGNNPSGLYGVWDWLASLPVFYLGAQDAVLWVGCTPPAVEYFSARSYVFSSPWPNATVLFASLGDSNNIETFNTTAGGPCNRTAAIITTGTVERETGCSPVTRCRSLPPRSGLEHGLCRDGCSPVCGLTALCHQPGPHPAIAGNHGP